MKAIFIGGPLHGQIKQIESTDVHVVWEAPRSQEDQHLTVVHYRRRIDCGEVGVFTMHGSESDKQLVKAVERGLQVSSEPTVRKTIEILFSVHAGHAFFQPSEDEPRNIEFLTDLVKSYWDRQIKFKTVK